MTATYPLAEIELTIGGHRICTVRDFEVWPEPPRAAPARPQPPYSFSGTFFLKHWRRVYRVLRAALPVDIEAGRRIRERERVRRRRRYRQAHRIRRSKG